MFIYPTTFSSSKVNSVETTKRFFHKLHFSLHSSIEHSSCLVVLGNNGVGEITLKFLFPMYVTLMVFCEEISSICWLLCKIGKGFLIWSSYRRMIVFCMTLMDKETYSYFLTWELAAKIVISAINKNLKSIYVMFIVMLKRRHWLWYFKPVVF